VIEETGLPKRRLRFGGKSFQDCSFQSLRKGSQNEALIATNKQMQMIRHNDISAYRHVKFSYSSRGVQQKSVVGCFQARNVATMQSADGYEEQRCAVRLKDLR
jgi:hypothetical protein